MEETILDFWYMRASCTLSFPWWLPCTDKIKWTHCAFPYVGYFQGWKF